jgi:hypothetical protein
VTRSVPVKTKAVSIRRKHGSAFHLLTQEKPQFSGIVSPMCVFAESNDGERGPRHRRNDNSSMTVLLPRSSRVVIHQEQQSF